MGFSTLEITIIVITVVLLLFWLYLLFAGRKYDELFEELDEDDHQLIGIYSSGYAFMELIKYQYKSKRDREIRKNISILYDEKYAEFYLRVAYAKAVSYAFLVLIVGFSIFIFSGESMLILITLMFAFVAVYYYLTKSKEDMKDRKDELMTDFAEVVSQLALLTNAGMVLHDAWEQIAYSKNTALYAEMQLSCVQMNNGVSDGEAITQFGVRCIEPEIKKFSSTIVQGISKGNADLVSMLIDQSDEVWEARKQSAKTQGELASNKLMIPTMIVFLGIIIMIVVPIFTGLGV